LYGPIAIELEDLFLSTWRAEKEPGTTTPAASSERTAGATGDCRLWATTSPFTGKTFAKRMSTLSGGAEAIFLTQAYFLPPARVLKELTSVARHGVRVR